jgi:hypothetical protein
MNVHIAVEDLNDVIPQGHQPSKMFQGDFIHREKLVQGVLRDYGDYTTRGVPTT